MLDHVVWLGGGTGSGKTTVARILAARHGLRLFQVDSFWYDHAARLGERWPAPEEQWLAPPAEQAADFERTSRGRLRLALEDIERLPREPPVLVEGPQVLADLLPAGAAAAFLVATRAFQERILARRPMPETSDGRRALANRIEKDRLYAEQVAALARRHGFPVLRVDGSRPPEEVAAEVERGFRLRRAGAAELGAVRRWENEVFAANVRSWLASADAPPGPPGGFSFGCECGRPGCAERVELTIGEFDALRRVLAPQH